MRKRGRKGKTSCTCGFADRLARELLKGYERDTRALLEIKRRVGLAR